MNAIITGATKGMGRAIAIKLAEAGYSLAICARRQSEVDSFCESLRKDHPAIRVIGLQTDCSDPNNVKQFASFVQQHFERVDVLINNVGTFEPASVLDEDDDVFLRQLNINYLSAYILCKEFGRQMRDRQSGHIINICSVAALNPVASAGSYSVTKAALLSLTRVLRADLMKHKVKVTAIHPGSTLTNSWKGTTLSPDRFIEVKDIAETVMTCLTMSAGANVDEIVLSPLQGNI